MGWSWGYKAARLQLSTLVNGLLSARLSWNSSMWLCILCSVIKFPLFLLPLVSRVLPAARLWQIDGPKKMEERRRRPQLILVCRSRGSFDAVRGSPSPPFAGSQRPFAGSQRLLAAHVSPLVSLLAPPSSSSSPLVLPSPSSSPLVPSSSMLAEHPLVPLGVLVVYEGMDWSSQILPTWIGKRRWPNVWEISNPEPEARPAHLLPHWFRPVPR